MRINTLQLVHHGSYTLCTWGNLDAHGLFNAKTHGMAVMMCTEVIQTIGQCQSLSVITLFCKFFYTSVNISQDRVDAFDGFTFNSRTHA